MNCFPNVTDRLAVFIYHFPRSGPESPALAGNAQNLKPAAPTVWPHNSREHERTGGPRRRCLVFTREEEYHMIDSDTRQPFTEHCKELKQRSRLIGVWIETKYVSQRNK